MPRDYKNINNKKKSSDKAPWLGVVVTFFTGLSLGLFVAFLIYLYYQNELLSGARPKENIVEVPKSEVKEEVLPKPKFDFYKILPNREVNISEWVAEEQDKEVPIIDDENVYILQVGSFKKYSAADQVKAQLALMGINSEIQRVVINGQDVRHRVRIGPYKNSNQLKEARQRLQENNLDFMILQLKVDDLESTRN